MPPPTTFEQRLHRFYGALLIATWIYPSRASIVKGHDGTYDDSLTRAALTDEASSEGDSDQRAGASRGMRPHASDIDKRNEERSRVNGQASTREEFRRVSGTN